MTREKISMARPPLYAGLVLAALLFAAPSSRAAPVAGTVEDPPAIRAAIVDAVKTRLTAIKDATAEVGAIDSRLRLPACAALDVGLPASNAAAMTAKVTCAAPNWTIYVPVRLHAWVDAVVAATNLAPNTKLTADDLSRARVDMYGAAGGVLTKPASAIGKVLRVGVLAGSPIPASFLEMPLVVHRGQTVLLTLSDGTMVIRDSVVALEDGRIGDNIAVRNTESDKIVHATVAADGSVEMRF
jgi:flagella basal body P-ring formation protein FlgA